MAVPADPTSVMGRRTAAVVIDAAVVMGPAIALVTSELEYYEEDRFPQGVDSQEYCDRYLEVVDDSAICFAVGERAYVGDPGFTPVLLLWGTAVLLYVLAQGLTGWTVGKLITGIRVVDEQGGRPGIGRAFVRWLLWLVDGLPYLLPGLVAFITGLTTVGHRRVGDMVAKTYVVHAAAAGAPISPPSASPPSGSPLAPPPSAAGPQWDETRGTYIQWDPEASAWMQWDDEGGRWERLPGQATRPPPPPPPPPPAQP
ncbi:MAG TPA: RDD family protein [Acidimicrobiales bacterium]|nr:RDD family protein [Acidimicrobiales bacterium]